MAKLSPALNAQVFDENGDPAIGWQIYSYTAGSSSALATYSDAAGTVPQANPITLNALGLPDDGPIWLADGKSYKFILKDSDGVTKATFDNISGVNDANVTISQWQASGVTPTYVSASSFTVPGDQTSAFHIGRRLQFTTSAGTVYGTITATAYTTLTTVTMDMDGAQVLDSGLSAVNLSLITADPNALPPKFVTDLMSDNNLGAPGYQKFPGGLIIQWGSGVGGTPVTFPIEFPNAARSIACSPQSGTTVSHAVTGLSKTGATVVTNNSSTGAAVGIAFYYTVFGC
jgi:hypothetical protein